MRAYPVSMGELAGMRGLKQIARSLRYRETEKEEGDGIFERHSQHFLNRCYPDAMLLIGVVVLIIILSFAIVVFAWFLIPYTKPEIILSCIFKLRL